MLKVLEGGPWMIRNASIILNQWSPDIGMVKADITTIPVWIKLHEIPLVGYTDDGLSAIATKVGKPLMFDSYTSNMCMKAWGRPSFARVMIEVSSENVLKDKIVVAIPKLDVMGYTKCDIKVKYEWKPPRCAFCKVFGHVDCGCTKKLMKFVPNKKKVDEENKTFNIGPRFEYRPKQLKKDQPCPSNPSSNSFGPLNSEIPNEEDPNGKSNIGNNDIPTNDTVVDISEPIVKTHVDPMVNPSKVNKQADEDDIYFVDGEIEKFMEDQDKTKGASTPDATVLHV